MARYINADEFEYDVIHLDVDVAEHKCKDYESYINGANQFRHQVKVALRHKPTADVEKVKQGHFVRNERNIPKMKEFHEKGFALSMNEKSIFYTCSECGEWISLSQKYCSECGAKMDGGNEE